MADKDDIAVGAVNRSLGCRYIVCKGRGWVLYRNYFVSLVHQRIDYLAPRRTVRPKPVDKNDRRFCFHGSPSLRKCVRTSDKTLANNRMPSFFIHASNCI